MDKELKLILAFLTAGVLIIGGLLWYASTLPGNPNTKVCPVVGNIAICEE